MPLSIVYEMAHMYAHIQLTDRLTTCLSMTSSRVVNESWFDGVEIYDMKNNDSVVVGVPSQISAISDVIW